MQQARGQQKTAMRDVKRFLGCEKTAGAGRMAGRPAEKVRLACGRLCDAVGARCLSVLWNRLCKPRKTPRDAMAIPPIEMRAVSGTSAHALWGSKPLTITEWALNVTGAVRGRASPVPTFTPSPPQRQNGELWACASLSANPVEGPPAATEFRRPGCSIVPRRSGGWVNIA